MSITAEDGEVVWRMRWQRAVKIAGLMMRWFPNASEGPRLEDAAMEARQQDATG
jgi:hypothetical protein